MLSVLVLSLLPVSTPLPTTGWDKTNHVLGFAILALLAGLGYRGQELRVAAGLLAYGVLIEALQALSGYRFAEWGDLLSDGIGIVLGLLTAYVARRTLPVLR
nr:VanZ family protein [Pseudomonas sp.]